MKWSRVRGSNPPLQPYESRPLPYRGPARASAAGLEPAVTGIKIRRLGRLGDALLNLVLPTGVQPAKSSVESAVPLAPGDGRLVRAVGIEPNTSCLEDRHAAHYATPAKFNRTLKVTNFGP